MQELKTLTKERHKKRKTDNDCMRKNTNKAKKV